MNRITIQHGFVFALWFVAFSFSPAHSQLSERVSLGSFNGFEVSYQLEILGTKARKKGDRTEYRMIAFAKNLNSQSLFCDNSGIVSVSVSNSPSLSRTATVSGRSTGYQTVDNRSIFEFPAGVELQGTVKFTVDGDSEPVVAMQPGCNYREMDGFMLRPTPMLVNGRWQQENQMETFGLQMRDSTISMQTIFGQVDWKAEQGNPGVFIRELREGGENGRVLYVSRIQVRGLDTILYTNTEGVRLFWKKR